MKQVKLQFICILLGLFYILIGLIQILTLGLVRASSMPDYNMFLKWILKEN